MPEYNGSASNIIKIFTPLFLGSQLLVPAKEDIQHELLAKWMKREKATVTHLTPGGLTSAYVIACGRKQYSVN